MHRLSTTAKKLLGSLSLPVLLAAAATLALLTEPVCGQTVLLSDDLSTGSGWSYSHGEGSAQPVAGDTSSAEFGFDYSAFGIPEAPNSNSSDTATSGLRVATNLTGAFGGDAVAAVYEDPSFTGQYTVQVDMWLNWAAIDGSGIGTTEHGGLYVGFDVNDAQNSFAPGQNGAGLTIATDGDCGNCGYILNKDGAELDLFSGQYSVVDFGFGNQPGYDETDVNTNPANGDLIDLPAFFPAVDIGAATNNLQATGTQKAGVAGFQWITITAEVDTNAAGQGSNGSVGTTKFSIENAATGNSVVIGTVDNSVDDDPLDGEDTGEQPVNMAGGIGLMWIDFFGGPPNPPQFGFGLFDNVRVFVPGVTTAGAGDFDGSLAVGNGDLTLLLDGWGGAPGAAWVNDVPVSVGNDSLTILLDNWGNTYGELAAISTVPEPTALVLGLLGLALGGGLRRR